MISTKELPSQPILLTTQEDLSQRWIKSTTWRGEYNVYHSSNGDRNSKRIPDYHRLDLAMTLDLKPKTRFGRDIERDLVISIYNAYARKNAFSVYVNPGEAELGAVAVPEYKQLAILGTILPSISYNFKF